MLSYSFINPGGASGKGLSLPMQETQKTGGSIPGWGRSPGGGHGNPLRYSCLENPMDRGAWWAMVHRVTWVRHDWGDLARMQVSLHRNLLFDPKIFLTELGTYTSACRLLPEEENSMCPFDFGESTSYVERCWPRVVTTGLLQGSPHVFLLSCSNNWLVCDPMDYSLPGSSVHGIFQARILEWAAISFSMEDFNLKPIGLTFLV